MTVEELAMIQEMLGSSDWEGVETVSTQLLQSEPADGSVLLFRASARQRLGKISEAAFDYSGVISLWPDDAVAYAGRAGCYMKMANSIKEAAQVRMIQRALIDMDEAVALDPGDADYKQIKAQIADILPKEANIVDVKIDYWSVAEKVSKVVGAFVGAAL